MSQSVESTAPPTSHDAGQGSLIERVCPHCGSGEFAKMEAYSKDTWRVGECGSCGFVYLQNVPVYDRMVEEFSWEKTWTDERSRRLEERPTTARASLLWRRLRKPFRRDQQDMLKGLIEPGPVLDIGCGTGPSIDDDAYTPYGIELSRELYEISDEKMRKRGGYCVHASAVEGIKQFEEDMFGGVIMRSFLEHEWQPRELLAGAHRVMRAGGKVFVRVPNFASWNRTVRGGEWCGFRYPDHVNYFTPDSLRCMAADCGFSMRLLNPVKVSVDDNIKAVLTKLSPEQGANH